LKKVCYKVSLYEKCQQQTVVRHSLANRAKMIDGAILPEIFNQTGRVGAKSPIFDLFSLVAAQL